jgi:hypothetical protein
MDTKTCIGCGEEKLLTEFNYKSMRRGTRQVRCRACTREQVREHYQAHQLYNLRKAIARRKRVVKEQREWILNYLETHPCRDCGEADVRCLDFDHVSGEKVSHVSRMVGNFGWEAIEREIAKCEVRCANCHRKRTWNQRKLGKQTHAGTRP